MPKINSAGEPSYAEHSGVVTNAVGEQFEVDPTRDLNGEHADGYESKPVEQFDESPAPGLDGPITAVDEENDDKDSESDERKDAGRDNAQSPRLVDHRQSEDQHDAGRTAAKKSAPAATKK